MDPILIVVILVVVLGGVAFFAMRRSADRTLPPEGEKKKELPREAEAKKAKKAKEEPARPKPAKEPEEGEAEAPARAKEPEGGEAAAPARAREPEGEEPEAPAKAEEPAEEAPGTQAPAARAEGEPSTEEVEELKKGLKSTRGGFISRLAKLFGRKKEIDPALLDEIEEVLITADLGVKTTDKILAQLRERLERNELSDEDRVWEALREEALSVLSASKGGVGLDQQPTVLLVVGVNGVGKTTTIGKLADRFKSEGKEVILAAGDTFRAAAVLQLEVWGRRVGCPVVKGKERADPGSVIFDAIKKAQDEGADVVIADTAGRLHTKVPLMEELKKVARTVDKALGRPADETLLVLDSTNGQNAIQQAQMFKDALDVSGIVLTKLDGTAKGGVILGIVDEHGIPVRYIGIGERVEDLREFDAPSFVKALFEKPDDESMAA